MYIYYIYIYIYIIRVCACACACACVRMYLYIYIYIYIYIDTDTHRGWPHRGPGVCAICVRTQIAGRSEAARGEGAGGGAGEGPRVLNTSELLAHPAATPLGIFLLIYAAVLWVIFLYFGVFFAKKIV